MKISTIIVIAIASTFIFGIQKNNVNTSEKKILKKGNGIALVELFTSEGCSSCPPADALVARVSKEFNSNVTILSFHVDYWDRLGWKDKYSSPLWTQRQQEYVYHFDLNGAYTPQIVVNGTEEFVGSNINKLYASIAKNIESVTNKPAINITAKTTTNKVTVSYNTTAMADYKLCFALIQSSGFSQVKKGENEGKLLQHINIVKDFKTINSIDSEKEISFLLPPSFSANEHKIIAFLQHKSNYSILSVAECTIN